MGYSHAVSIVGLREFLFTIHSYRLSRTCYCRTVRCLACSDWECLLERILRRSGLTP